MPRVKSIFLANLAEVALPLTHLMKGPRAQEEIFEDHALCDRFLFSCKDEQVLITPFPIDKNFFNDNHRLLNLKNVLNISPKKVGESLCLSVLEKVGEIVRKNPGVEIVSYAATPEFYELTGYLRQKGLEFSTPEAPKEEDFWAQDFFDSKAGFRQAVESLLPGFPAMPEGVVCFGKTEITGWAKYWLEKFGGCVLKANRGLAGAGLKIIKNLKDLAVKERYWNEEPVVVERFIPPDLSVCGGAPNIELRIRGGKTEVLYVCSMRIDKEGVFLGVEMGHGAVPEKLTTLLEKSGKQFGKLLESFGYRGYFEVDWVYGRDSKTYPIEANLRRTGGTHVYEACRRLLGKDVFKNFYVVANNNSLVRVNLDYAKVKKQVIDLLYPIAGHAEGVIITVTNYLRRGKIGYMVIASDKDRAAAIEKRFQERLS